MELFDLLEKAEREGARMQKQRSRTGPSLCFDAVKSDADIDLDAVLASAVELDALLDDFSVPSKKPRKGTMVKRRSKLSNSTSAQAATPQQSRRGSQSIANRASVVEKIAVPEIAVEPAVPPRRTSQQTGPSEDERLVLFPWFVAGIDRDAAERLLANEAVGTCLVRKSKQGFVFSVKGPHAAEENASGEHYNHIMVQQNPTNGLYSISDETDEEFKTIPELIRYYMTNYEDFGLRLWGTSSIALETYYPPPSASET